MTCMCQEEDGNYDDGTNDGEVGVRMRCVYDAGRMGADGAGVQEGRGGVPRTPL